MPLSTEALSFFQQVGDLSMALGGSPAQRAYAQAEVDGQDQVAYAACMRKAGYDYEPAAPEPSDTNVYYSPTWWALPSLTLAERGLGYAQPPIPEQPALAGDYQSLSDADRADYDAALEGCLATTASRLDESGLLRPRPERLLQELNGVLMGETTSMQFQALAARYAACMAGSGNPVDEPGRVFDLAESRIDAVGLFQADPRSSDYPRLLEKGRSIEVAVAEADVVCRSPLADDISRLLSPTLDNWLAQFGAAASVAAKEWPVVS